MRLAIWQKGNLFKFSGKTFSLNNGRATAYSPSPKIPIKPNTTYTLVVEYSDLSFTVHESGQNTLGFGIGRGASSYSSDIVYRQEYPKSKTETSGKLVYSFTTKSNIGEGQYLYFRPLRQDVLTTASVTWNRAMVLEGAYTAEIVPDFIPYTDGSPLVEIKSKELRLYAKEPRLPKGYRELEYIEADGSQYMKTGITATGNTRVVAKMMCLAKNSAGKYAYLFASGSPKFSVRMHWSNGLPYNTYGSTTSITFYESEVGDLLNIDFGAGTATINTYSKNIPYVEFTDGELQLFARKGSDRSKGRMWEFDVYEGETLEGSLVPCIDPDGVVGAYNLVTNEFRGSALSTPFVAGPVVETESIIKKIKIGDNS